MDLYDGEIRKLTSMLESHGVKRLPLQKEWWLRADIFTVESLVLATTKVASIPAMASIVSAALEITTLL